MTMAFDGNTRTVARRTLSSQSSLRTRQHVAEIQRARIVNAMIEVVALYGYANSSVERIVRRARISRTTFYALFDSREDCFYAAFEGGVRQLRSVMDEAYRREDSWEEGLRASLAAMLTLFDSEPSLAQLLVVEAMTGCTRVLRLRARTLEVIASVVDRGRGEYDRTEELPALTAEGAVGAVFSVIHKRLVERGQEPLIELHGSLMSLLLLPYAGLDLAMRESSRVPRVKRSSTGDENGRDPARPRVELRLTGHIVNCLLHIGFSPGASNREVADAVGIGDQGQISKLLARLASRGVIENRTDGSVRGAPNAWHLSPEGRRLEAGIRDAARVA
jgi:AcrR family transcriptional regulator